jgi:outer membrane protein assembly factor BamB
MKPMRILVLPAVLAASLSVWGAVRPAAADDKPSVKAIPFDVAPGTWPMWGRDATRNMVSPEKNPPVDWDVKSGKNIKWKARLGSQSYGNTVVSGGRVFVGTNNEGNYNPKYVKTGPDGKPALDDDGKPIVPDASVLLCFDEKTGKFLWQSLTTKHPAGRVIDWPFQGVCCSPLVEGERGWYCTPRCEVICFDVRGAKGITGGEFKTDENSGDLGPAILWKVRMIEDLGVFPHNMTSCSIGASYKNLIYVITGNGVDESHKNIPSPKGPSLIAFDKDTGKVVWTDSSPGVNILHGQWASPIVIEVGGKGQVVVPQGDGWIRSFDALTGKLVWKFDSNNKDTVYPTTRNELIATPVLYEGRIYIANGQDPEHGEGPGHLWCIDPTKTGDISLQLDDGPGKGKPNPNSGVVWHFEKDNADAEGQAKSEDTMHRTISTVAIHDGLVIAPDFSGFVHCLDARTGKKYWTHDMLAAMWGSPLIVDGKVYICDEDGDVCIFELSKEKKLIAEHNLGAAVYCSPVFANGTLYLMNRDTLFAISEKK